jgi:cyclophilin family peptidyl-prolyl cis-trans isomerase/HEAT repeat protein
MNKHFLPLFIIFTFIFTQCVPPSGEIMTDVHVDFTNPFIQNLYNFQDKGMGDSLYQYFQHDDPTFRYLSVMAFASLKDSAAIDNLVKMLNDPVDDVRVAAAYALGQIGNPKAENPLIDAFDRYDTSGVSRYFNAAILEAIGKCGTQTMLDNLASISTYRPSDTLLMEGQAWGIYRFALRDTVSEKGTAVMMDFATNLKYPPNVRLIGANYLSRAKNITLVSGDSLISPALAKEDDPRIRMALAIALGKTKSERAANVLLYQYNLERDYRVKCNIVRALGNFDYETVKATVYQALNDPSTAVAVTAAQYFVDNGVPEEASTYWQLAKQPGRKWEVGMKLYAAASKHLPYGFEESRKYLNWELKRRFENAPSPYEKGEALKALAQNGWNYRYIRDAAYPSDLVPVRTAAVEALAGIARMPNFNGFFGGSSRVKQELSDCFRDAIENGDIGMMAVAAEVLRDPALNFKSTFDSLTILENALKKLRIPQEIETYNEVKKTLDYFKGVENGELAKPKYNHKIDWKLITDFKPDSKIILKTSKGDITLRLMPDYAPGTVANFLELIRDKFYEGKNFHRVVPNFVIQGGCPRGDGYGSLAYTIRSELPYLHYDREGYVGMASAGNHTEGTQFFITHSPTPHLDGNYTIFARVTDGMDVVHQIEIGDVIKEVVIEVPK